MKEKNSLEPIYTVTGSVVHGRGIGKHVGTPTANIKVDEHATLPETGAVSYTHLDVYKRQRKDRLFHSHEKYRMKLEPFGAV